MNVDLIAFHTFHSQSRIVNLVLLAEELFMSHDDSFSEERKCEFLGRSIKYFDQTWSAWWDRPQLGLAVNGINTLKGPQLNYGVMIEAAH